MDSKTKNHIEQCRNMARNSLELLDSHNPEAPVKIELLQSIYQILDNAIAALLKENDLKTRDIQRLKQKLKLL